MNPRPRALVVMFMLATLAAALAASAPEAGSEPSADDWTERLEALKPDEPMAYFELAEEIADAAGTDEDRALARKLFGLAGALSPDRLGRSACLALADMETREPVRRRLMVLAAVLDRRPGEPAEFSLAASEGAAIELQGEAALAVSEAFSHYRAGRGPRALTRLRTGSGAGGGDEGAAMRLLGHAEAALRGGVDRFLNDCKHYRGQSRPALSEEDIALMLRFEQAILSGNARSWSADLTFTGGASLIEVQPDRLDEMFEVDATTPYWRDGEWAPGARRD